MPAPFTFGTAPRNSVIGPGYATLDLAVAKDWKIGREEFRIPLESFSTRWTRQTTIGRIASSEPQISHVYSARRARVKCSSAQSSLS